MKRFTAALAFVILLSWTAPAPAQLLFAKKQKVNPSQRVPELILTLKTDPDERKRAHAAEELREYDTTTFSEIVPVLVDVLQNDKKMSVRLEAVTSLARIRPVSARAGQAIEKAAANDEAFRVRWTAKSALPKYHLAGYVSKKADVSATKKTTNEPPLAGPTTKKTTNEPPLAEAPTMPIPRVGAEFPRPLPPGVADPKKAPPVKGPSLFP